MPAQTIKQAKKSFKARGQPTLTEREVKQLQRARELDQRAWKAREAERRRAEAAQRRVQKEKDERLERESARLGSQRRCDRYGYQSSQFHLGKFFRVGAAQPDTTVNVSDLALETEPAQLQDADEFSDQEAGDHLDELQQRPHRADQEYQEQQEHQNQQQQQQQQPAPPLSPPPDICLIDDDLLESSDEDFDELHIFGALEDSTPCPAAANRPDPPPVQNEPLRHRMSPTAFSRSLPGPAAPTAHSPSPAPYHEAAAAAEEEEDLSSFWDELDSSTQIARDLDRAPAPAFRAALSNSSSFSFDDSDLTAEDLDRLDPPVEVVAAAAAAAAAAPSDQAQRDRRLMPPPDLPSLRAARSAMMPPPLPPQSAKRVESRGGSSGCRPCAADLGFTATQLESWVDDDILLSQMAPG